MELYISIDTMESLHDYLANHAATMREEALQQFPPQFIATRRILHALK